MKKLILLLGRMFIFWMLLFASLRGIFLLYYISLLKQDGISLSESLLTFYFASGLDMSTAAYVLMLPLVLILMAVVFQSKWPLRLLSVYTLTILLFYVLTVFAEIGLYAEWKTKLSYKALTYLGHPKEIIDSASTSTFILLITLWIGFSLLAYWIYRKWIQPKEGLIRLRKSAAILVFIFAVPLLFLASRGGLQQIPITTSAAYFSQHNILNLAAVNPGYNILVSTLDSRKLTKENPFKSMADEEAAILVKQLHETDCNSTLSILKVKRPNIVILLLESWSADLIESLGGEPGITPNFGALEKDGLLFTNFYASGNRSQQAIGSIYAGLPGLPITTITNHPEKYAALPSMVKRFNDVGYHSSFYFGGQLIYGNILSFLTYNQFSKIVEGKDIEETLPRGKLGVHDNDMLPWYARQLSEHPQPFVSTVFTLSSHSPYDFPGEHSILWPRLEKDFVNAAHYTDKAIAEFFAEAKQQHWYDSTLFLIVADHSHNTYRNHPIETFDYRKIPLLITGPALKDSLRGMHFDKICGNTDIPATLMAQMEMPYQEFFWSKDVLNRCYRPFAFFEFNEGLGFMTPQGHFVWNKQLDHYYQNTLPADSMNQITLQGKAYLQQLFQDFLAY